mgnify:CR=1 FL=1
MKFTTFLLTLMTASMISAQSVNWQKIDVNNVRDLYRYDTVLSAGDYERKISVDIYPNPAQDHFFIKSNRQLNQITIHDLSGKKIFKKSKDLTESNPIDISKLKTGIYLLQMETDQENVIIRKIIKK